MNDAAPVALRLEVLPARLGDCLLVECIRPDGTVWRMLVDGGPPDCWARTLRPRLKRLPDGERRLDVVVVSHIDSDHIGGLIPMFLDTTLGLDIGDVWFNGSVDRVRGYDQAERLTRALSESPTGGVFPWNVAFAGGPVATPEHDNFADITIPDGPRLTLLSPTIHRLQLLWTKWSAWLDETRGEEEDTEPPPPPPLTDLEALAASPPTKDSSHPNGSSIALLVEHRGASCVLAADAFGGVLTTALASVAVSRNLPTLPVDAVKLPHHGSRNNVPAQLMEAVVARNWVVSSNGDRFGHPDDIALARVVTGSPDSTIWFNYRNARTLRWGDEGLTSRYGYRVRYPKSPDSGAVLELGETS